MQPGVHWLMVPHDLPPWPVVYQQMRRSMAAACFESMVHDLGRFMATLQRWLPSSDTGKSSAFGCHPGAIGSNTEFLLEPPSISPLTPEQTGPRMSSEQDERDSSCSPRLYCRSRARKGLLWILLRSPRLPSPP